MTNKNTRSLISINDLSEDEIKSLIHQAEKISADPKKFFDSAKEKILSLLFFEPSTRTYFSFASAMHRLGGAVIGFSHPAATSIAKGESLEDTVRVMGSYSDMMVIRHPQVGTIKSAAELVNIPVINGGEGTGEHPTQTLTDLFTIYKNFGRLNINIAICGDLKYGRTGHSLMLAAARFGANFICISPENLSMPEEYLSQAKKSGAKVIVTEDIKKYLNEIDVLYVTRLQTERLPEHLKNSESHSLKINQALLNQMKSTTIVLHPFPRTEEIDPEIDKDPRTKYFEQAANGVAVRMAIISHFFKKF